MFQCRKAKSGGKSADLVLTAGEEDPGVPRARLTPTQDHPGPRATDVGRLTSDSAITLR